MNGMVDYALHYQRLGYSVVPIDKKSKRAITKYKDKTFSEHEIRLLWRDRPDANIAIKTTDFFVIDIDVKEDVNGFDSLKEWDLAQYIPPTLSARTPSGGRHIYLKKPPGVEISQDIKIRPGIDIKGNPNNYVLVPPSNNMRGRYEWDLSVEDMAVAPQEIVEILQKEKPAGTPLSFTTNYTPREFSSKTAKLFEQIVFGFGDEGGRNDALASFVGGLLFRGVDEEATYLLAKIANHYTPSPLPNDELDRTFESMLRKELDRRGGT
ncbi:bifunctional DNA primase/polymerase [Streptococcus sp. NLN76]|uniref:bifunctional DNA primase/polymerase n=1 Tax=Streptococcus sp. NLN76 TaxID=2822800 RepID=UPI0018A907E9|nr:bifunctional DNA primase/polymerase [Streptococcus sp. NLN76]MBF8970185.1 bifunctional DNA primase/polymerase [Streptococcus sp. NLN76]